LRDGKRCAVVRRRIGSLVAEVGCTLLPSGSVELRILADKTTYRFLAGAPGKPVEIASGETRYFSTQVAGGYTGVYFGLYATAHGVPGTAKASFDWFEYRVTGNNP